jgi:hypothetical protein
MGTGLGTTRSPRLCAAIQSHRSTRNTRGRHRKNGLPNLFDPDVRRHSGGLRNRVRSGDRTNRNPPYASIYRRQRGGGRGAMASMFAVQVGKLLPAKSSGRKADRSLGWRAERRRRVAVEGERSLRARLRSCNRSRRARTRFGLIRAPTTWLRWTCVILRPPRSSFRVRAIAPAVAAIRRTVDPPRSAAEPGPAAGCAAVRNPIAAA